MRFVEIFQMLGRNLLTKKYLQIRMASSLAGSENGITHSEEEFEGCKIKVTRGDYGALIGKVAEHLKEAKVVHKISTSFYQFSKIN